MSKQKEKKLKKLKKQRGWPYIVGIMLVVLVFLALSLVLMAFFSINLVYDKLQQGHDNSNKIVQLIQEEWEQENPDSIQEIGDKILRLMPNVGDICIVDSNQQVISQYGESIPDWNNYVSELSNDEQKYILTTEKDNFIYLDNGEINIKIEKVLKKIFANNMVVNIDTNIMESEDLMMVDFWYEMPLSETEYYVCVKNELPIKMTELSFMVVVLDIIIILAFVLIVYYLISIFRDRKSVV